jgi:Beta-galactosidase
MTIEMKDATCARGKCMRYIFVRLPGDWIWLLAMLIWLAPPAQSEAAGVYQQQLGTKVLDNSTNPYVDGVVAAFPWSAVEPQEKEFQWNTIEEAIRPWVAAGKKAILGVYTGSVGTLGERVVQATPDWVFAAGAAKMLGPDGTILPIYWDKIYLEKYKNLVEAFAKRYDGDPRIEFIRIGVGVWGEVVLERWFTRPESTELRDRWSKRGYDPALWIQTTENVMTIYRQAFQKTPCAIMLAGIHGDPKGIFRIAEKAVELGFYLQQNGLRADWKQHVNTSPISKIFQEYKGKTRLVLEAWGNTQRSEVFRSGEAAVQGALLETVKVGIQYGADYLLLYPPDIAKSDKRNGKIYDPSYEKALKYAHVNLRNLKSQ